MLLAEGGTRLVVQCRVSVCVCRCVVSVGRARWLMDCALFWCRQVERERWSAARSAWCAAVAATTHFTDDDDDDDDDDDVDGVNCTKKRKHP